MPTLSPRKKIDSSAIKNGEEKVKVDAVAKSILIIAAK